jgi:hypothetical protein
MKIEVSEEGAKVLMNLLEKEIKKKKDKHFGEANYMFEYLNEHYER